MTRQVDRAGDHLNADRFLAEHGKLVHYVPELGRWLVWTGAWWSEDRLETVRDLARQTIDGLRAWVVESSDDDFQRRSKHYTSSSRSPRIEGMLAIAKSHRELVVGVADLDQHAHLLACRNGTVDLQSGELFPAERANFITRGVDIEFDPSADSAEWLAFLETIFAGNDDTIAYVQRLLGYAMTGEVGEHILPTFHGVGANGKSQLIAAVTSVAGEHAVVAPDGLLVESKHEQHPERLAMLRGRRLVVSSELENRAVLAESLVKSLSGGDRISARNMYGPRFEFQPTHTLLLISNHLPRVRGTDEAIWRRLRVVPFEVVIPSAGRIPDYGRRLAEHHGPAILAWLVRGAVDWYRYGLGEAEKVRQATFTYRRHEDTFGQFLDECTTPIHDRTPVKALRLAWVEWATVNGTAVGRTQDFTRSLEMHDVDLESRQGARFARSIGLLESPASAAGVRSRDLYPVNLSMHPRVTDFTEERSREVTDSTSEPLSGVNNDDLAPLDGVSRLFSI